MWYHIDINKQEDNKMTAAEKKTLKARIADLIAQGIDRETAKAMAKVEIEYKLIAPVVNGR